MNGFKYTKISRQLRCIIKKSKLCKKRGGLSVFTQKEFNTSKITQKEKNAFINNKGNICRSCMNTYIHK